MYLCSPSLSIKICWLEREKELWKIALEYSRTFASEQETLMRRFDYSLVAFIGQYTFTTVS